MSSFELDCATLEEFSKNFIDKLHTNFVDHDADEVNRKHDYNFEEIKNSKETPVAKEAIEFLNKSKLNKFHLVIL